jgi:tetratricopeptide (TPR) repeat protein
MIIPKVNIDVWRELYAASTAFRDAAPWLRLMDSQIFAVKNPSTGELGYGCVMGAVGRLRALALYRGERGLRSYLNVLHGEDSDNAGDFAGAQDCLMAEWTDREYVDTEDRRVYKALGLKFKGLAGWPVFRSYVPRYAPWYLTEEEAAFLTLGLRAAFEVNRQLLAGLKIPEAPGRLFTLTPVSSGFSTEWGELIAPAAPVPTPIIPDPAKIGALRARGLKRIGIWEADVFMQPAIISDRDRPYFFRSALAADKQSGMILHFEPVAPEQPDESVLGDLLVGLMNRQGAVPAGIDVRQNSLAEALAPLARELDIRISVKKRLPAIAAAREGLEEFHRGGKSRAFEPDVLEESKETGRSRPPDRRALEGLTADLFRAVKESGASTQEELDAIVKGFNNGEAAPPVPRSPAEAAQQVMYEAWDASDVSERVTLAKRALKISADCADAYVLLAEETARTKEEKLALYQRGVEAGERALGPEFFKENVGHFWGMVESRPYMRARQGVAETLFGIGRKQEAFQHWRDMLRLNPNDNQGVRYALAGELTGEQRWQELADLLDGAYPDDVAAEWLYAKALLRFAQRGDCPESRQALAKAIRQNRFVPDYLIGKKAFPQKQPTTIRMGGEDEGCCAADLLLKGWRQTPGALDWLKGQTDAVGVSVPAAGRNDPCPCGSGKKYKKCCLA